MEANPRGTVPINRSDQYFDRKSSKLIECPFEVCIDGRLHDQFYDVRDATAAARSAKQNYPASTVTVTDARTRRLVIQIEA